MTLPPREPDSMGRVDLESDASGAIPLETVRPVSKRADPAWASEEWVTATVPIFTEATAIDATQEQDLVDAVVGALEGDHTRIQRVIDALTELVLKGR